jgi:O-antigen/teichoic acid export membrane protein
MAVSLGRLVRSAGFFGVPGVLARLSSLVTFPIMTKAMGVEAFGELDYWITIANFSAVAIVFGLDSVATRFYHDHDDPEQRRRVLSQVLTTQVALCALVPVIIYELLSAAGLGLASYPGASVLLALTLVQALLMAPLTHFQNYMMWADRTTPYLILTLGQVGLTVMGLLLVCVGRTPAVWEILTVFIVIRLVMAAYGAWACRSAFGFTLDLSGQKAFWAYGAPIGIIGLLGAGVPFIERQAIASVLTNADLGAYGAATRIALLILLPISAFQMVWVPFALSSLKAGGAEATYRLALKIFAIGGFICAFALAALSSPLLYLLTDDAFLGASVAVLALCVGVVVKGLGDVVQLGIDVSRKSWMKFFPFFAMTAVALVVVPMLARSFGIAGAAWGSLCAFGVKTILEYFLANAAHRFEWHAGRLAVFLVLGLALAILHDVVLASAGSVVAAVVALAGSGLLLIVGLLAVFTPAERSMLTNSLALARQRLQGT